ncbi:hypothetical protein NMG60_11027284 [Bertholletia excelsa]
MQDCCEVERNLSFNEDKMFRAGDFSLNPIQGYSNSLKEVVKKTMVSQEIIFQKQVHELHRLYRIQQTMMKNFGWKEFDGCSLRKESHVSTYGQSSNQLKYSPLAKEIMCSESPMMGSAQHVNKDFPKENPSDYSRLQKRPFDLQLPADCCDYYGSGSKGSVASKHQFDEVAYLEEANLTLSIGGDAKRKNGGNKSTWYGKVTRSSVGPVIIDLEDSSDTISNERPKSVSDLSFSALINGDEHDSKVVMLSGQLSTGSVKKDLSQGCTSFFRMEGSQSCGEKNSFNQGLEECHVDIACNVLTEQRPACKVFGLDLNQIQIDESSCLNEATRAQHSTVDSSGASDRPMGNFSDSICPSPSWIKPEVNSFSEPSNLLQQEEAANFTSRDPHIGNDCSKISVSNAKFGETTHSTACPIDLESVSGPLSEICENRDNNHRNSENGNVDLLVNFPEENFADFTASPGIKNLEEDRIEDGDSNKYPTSREYEGVAQDSSSDVKTVKSRNDLGGSNFSTSELFLSSNSSGDAETQSGDVDIQRAAESLIDFYLGSSAKAGSNEIEIEEMGGPQHSLDSYESIVLKLPESSTDDYCVSTRHFEVDELNRKDCGVKLKRGRGRMKDFQRDILPGLASLSRHEIREDVGIIEAVIRSREYKRMRSRMANGGNWFVPVKSKRSRLNYVGRRNYS